MKNIILVLTSIFLLQCSVKAQSVVIYRAGLPLSPSYTSIAAAMAVVANGDSVVLSAHKFYEHDIIINRSIKLIGIANGTTIDAQNLGRCLNASVYNLQIKDVILENGNAPDLGGGILNMSGTTILSGRTVIRYCYASGKILSYPTKAGGGGVYGSIVILKDNVVIANNNADGKGGGVVGSVYMYDSTMISYNSTTEHGGGVWGKVYGRSKNASINNNSATKWGGGVYGEDSGCVTIANNTAGIAGGGVYSMFNISEAIILGNQAPIGAALVVDSLVGIQNIKNSYIYNPSPSGKRQNEVMLNYSSGFNSQRCWWGKGDTIGIFKVSSPSTSSFSVSSWVVPNWQLNRGISPAKKDTLFPLQAALKYNMGAALVAGSMPWLKGYFSSSKGTMTPTMASVNAKDTIQSMFKSFIAPPVSQPVDFVAYIDLDTFKVTQLVWGIDTTTKKDTTTKGAIVEPNPVQVYVYPIPASKELHISGAAIGSMAALFDMNGRQILTMKIEEYETILPIHNIAVGTYTLRILAHNGSIGIAKVQKE